MRKIIYIFFILCSSMIYAQEAKIIITGKTIDSEIGESMIGVSISEKGTNNGTVSDIDGNFSLTLQSKEEATVRVVFIGYGTAEIKINKSEYWEVFFDSDGTSIRRSPAEHLQEPLTPSILSSQLRNEKNGVGVMYMEDNMPQSYFGESLYFIKDIKSLSKGYYSIKKAKGKHYTSGYKIDFSSSLDVSLIGRVPKWQSEFSQGREGIWNDQNEMFSWGPSITEIQEQNKDIKVYSPDNFFRTGVSFGNTLNVKVPGLNSGFTNISLGQKRENSPIPYSYKEHYNTSLAMRDIKNGYFNSDIGIYYNTSYGKLTQQNSNIANIMHAVYTTPPTFDNLNGMSKRNNEAWFNKDGTYRSYAPSFSDNPYALINELPDREKNEYLMTFFRTKYEYDKLVWDNKFSFDKLWNRFSNGTLPYISDARTYLRKDQTTNIIFNSALKWNLERYNPRMHINISYDFKHTSDKFFQEDKLLPQDALYNLDNKKLIRNSHYIKYGFDFENNKLLFNIANGHYFSNTAHSRDYSNVFPELGVNIKLNHLLEDLFDWDYHSLSFYGNIKRSIGETALIERIPSVLSTTLKAEDFRSYYEYQLPIYNNNLKPEIYIKSEIGLKYRTSNSRLTVGLSGYNHHTHNLISPLIEDYSPILSNVGRMRSYGYFVELDYCPEMPWKWDFNIKYTFSQGKTKATALYGNQEFIRLAGFSDIATIFANKQPLGTIYGTTYQRNDQGEIIVDQEGFPMVNTKIEKIGDPTPDFVMTLNPNLSYKRFTLNLWIEYSHGGDRWNGTKAFMDYHGVSKSSANNRNIKGYIFEGVDQSGNINQQPVDFYDPYLSVYKNRWTRYGMAGVGEEYIEKATYLRLSNITLKYTSDVNNNKFIKEFSVGISAQNLFLITSYKGVDPATQMFGYSSARGLDLFNSPSLRSYSFVVTIGL